MNDLEVARIKREYPKGTRILCKFMDDPFHPIPSGTYGTVKYVDDAGQIHMSWDCGGSLALVPEVDSFEKVESESE